MGALVPSLGTMGLMRNSFYLNDGISLEGIVQVIWLIVLIL